jgi:DNA-binding CsgD family transcriptional regulator
VAIARGEWSRAEVPEEQARISSPGRPHAALRLWHDYRASDFATLTAMPRARAHPELKDLRFLARNVPTMEIADELCLSVNTVKTHLAAIYRKLPADRRREAVLQARELELI